ncbi:MAG: hypothetical protein KAR40_13860 [Candidatus Sabulitectum sp.]|nr:hypothetical protein [Candidatus Sabulitectum sp.]
MKTGTLASKAVLSDQANIEPFILTKQHPGGRDDTGEYIAGSDIVFPNLEGSVQPLDGKSRLQLPEGERLLDAICILFHTLDHDAIAPLRIGKSQTESDTITWNGLLWAVRVVYDMASYGHLEVFATRLEGQDG